MNRYRVELTGLSPLLMHRDNIDAAEKIKAWLKEPENQKHSVKGDDRSPPWTWLGSLYSDGTHVCMPSDNLMRVAMEGGASVPAPGGRSGKTLKAQTQSGMLVSDEFVPLLLGNGNPIDVAEINALIGEMDFAKHQSTAAALGLSLFVKRARIGASKHVRVRPRFEQWSLVFSLDVWDEQLSLDALKSIWRYGGQYKGLGDWRPSSRTPGPFGRFEAKISKA